MSRAFAKIEPQNSIAFLWHGVISASAPRVAAEYAADGEVEAFDWAMLAEGLEGILGASGRESAAGLLEGGGDADLVESYQKYEGRDQDFPDHALNFLHLPIHFS